MRAFWAVRESERGSGTVLALGVIAVLLSLALATAGIVQAYAAQARVQAAADLSALAGASAWNSVAYPGDPCARAATVAEANGASVESCWVDGEDVRVIAVVLTRVLGVERAAHGRARAGPVGQ